MFRKPVKVTEIEIDGQRYVARYFEQKTARGSRRFSCEVTIDAGDLATDIHAGAAYRANLISVMAQRAVAKALG